MASKTFKYILIGGGAAVAVYFVAKKLKSDEPKQPTPATAVGQIVGGVKDLYNVLSDKMALPKGGVTPKDTAPSSAIPVYTADGDAAIANADGKTRIPVMMPMQPAGYRDRAIAATINYDFYGLPPAKSKA